MNQSNTRKLVTAALMLAIAVASMFFKNTSVLVTGSIVNTCLMLTALSSGLVYAIIMSAVTPIFSFIITGSPVMAMVPAIIPMVMIGNAILVICVWAFNEKVTKLKTERARIICGGIVGSVLKAAFMGLTISVWLLPSFLPQKLMPKLGALKMQFSLIQLVTSLIGLVITLIVWQALKRALRNNN